MERILYYNPLPLADLSRLRAAVAELGAELRVVPRGQLHQSIGFLAGFPGCPERSAEASSAAPAEPVMIFCGFDPDRLDAALDALRQRGLSAPLKAVLTQTNKTWSFSRLAAELHSERSAIARTLKKD